MVEKCTHTNRGRVPNAAYHRPVSGRIVTAAANFYCEREREDISALGQIFVRLSPSDGAQESCKTVSRRFNSHREREKKRKANGRRSRGNVKCVFSAQVFQVRVWNLQRHRERKGGREGIGRGGEESGVRVEHGAAAACVIKCTQRLMCHK